MFKRQLASHDGFYEELKPAVNNIKVVVREIKTCVKHNKAYNELCVYYCSEATVKHCENKFKGGV